ncbi:MAG: bifunctional nuclease family protein [Anaerolineae bacterium]
MIEVTIDSVRVSLMSSHRLVVLRETSANRYLPIWIGPFEADAITIQLQEVEVARPLTHDLLRSTIEHLGARVSHIVVNDLRNDTFYAVIVLDVNGRGLEIDSRPSDAIALAVRAHVPIFVEDHVMDSAAITPEEELTGEGADREVEDEELAGLSAYRDFLEDLDLDLPDEQDD